MGQGLSREESERGTALGPAPHDTCTCSLVLGLQTQKTLLQAGRVGDTARGHAES